MNQRSNQAKQTKTIKPINRFFSIEIKSFLIQEYEKQPYPSSEMIQIFANKCNLTSGQVRTWFKDQRYRKSFFNRNKMNFFGRTHSFPDKTKQFLLKEYEKQRYPSTEMIQIFANKLNLTKNQVNRWFCKRRSKNGHVENYYQRSIFFHK
jgi:hypothetical protein